MALSGTWLIYIGTEGGSMRPRGVMEYHFNFLIEDLDRNDTCIVCRAND